MCQWIRYTMLTLGSFILSASAFSQTKGSQTPSSSGPDAKALEVADKLMQALGGQENWEKARFLRFDFVVEEKGKVTGDFKHLWDRYTGRYRVEGTNEKGQKYVVLFQDINAKQGDVFVNGKPASAEERKKFLGIGYERFINDSYWLLMPYKWRDPGVHLKYEGTAKGEQGQVWDKVLLTFEKVGLTPKDRYWAFINQQTGLMDKWEFILQGEKGPATRFDWLNWQKYGGIMLSNEMKMKAKPMRILFENLAVATSIDEKPFTSFEASLY